MFDFWYFGLISLWSWSRIADEVQGRIWRFQVILSGFWVILGRFSKIWVDFLGSWSRIADEVQGWFLGFQVDFG